MSKILVSYFSASGVTKRVAEKIAEAIKGDLFEIEPVEKYTPEDLDWTNKKSRSSVEMQNKSFRPKIKDNNLDISNYDIILIGFPIWWGDVPKIILTFLDTYDLSGKTVIPFCTSGGSGISTSMNTLRNYNQNINWIDGEQFLSGASKNAIESWINSLD